MRFRETLEHAGKCFPFSFSVYFESRNGLFLVYREFLECGEMAGPFSPRYGSRTISYKDAASGPTVEGARPGMNVSSRDGAGPHVLPESTVRAAGSVTAESTSHRSHAGEGRPVSSECRERGPVPHGAACRWVRAAVLLSAAGQVCRLIQGTLTVINGATSNTSQTKSQPEPGRVRVVPPAFQRRKVLYFT